MKDREEKRNKLRMQIGREELVERMAGLLPEDGTPEVFPGLFLGRSSKPTESVHPISLPAFCFVVQGGKRALLGEEIFWYDPGHYLLYTVDLRLYSMSKKRRKNDLISASLCSSIPPLLLAPASESVTRIRRISAATTRSNSALRRSATSRGCAATLNSKKE